MKKLFLQGMCIGVVMGNLIGIVGCGIGNNPKEIEKGTAKENCVEGVYLTYGENNELYIFSDEKEKTLFMAEIPDDIVYDTEGNKESREILDYGDVVKVYYDGEVTESMPPRYMDVTKVVLTEKVTEVENKKEYEKLIAEMYPQSDESSIPMMAVETVWTDGPGSAKVSPYSYEWTYDDKNGESQHTVSFPMDNQMIPQIPCENKNVETNLYFSKQPNSVKATIISEKGKKKEDVTIIEHDLGFEIGNAESGNIYQIEANWGEGRSIIFRFTLMQF